MARRGMNDQPGGLVDHCEVLVLEQNLEWNRRRAKGAGRLGIGKPDVDPIGAGREVERLVQSRR